MSAPDAFAPPCWADGPAFAEPWQAEVLAIAFALSGSGLFTAGLWSATLGAELRRREADGAPDTRDTYFAAALAALESLVTSGARLDAAALERRVEQWREAYLDTPHGQPVQLGRHGPGYGATA